ncbi:hypothetical protein BpHYR1_053949 [Brachionus plicatilis]|uniref:Uncharacterized protein n=1 Tax=Brachionus plicatilis TaxID=10195 RepID=A0A3M7SSC4_BRAPC|nr:hypothetical protein BpHYR1_053949 [Brachionus plicatilis]
MHDFSLSNIETQKPSICPIGDFVDVTLQINLSQMFNWLIFLYFNQMGNQIKNRTITYKAKIS